MNADFEAVKAQRSHRARPLVAVIDDDEFIRDLAATTLLEQCRTVTAASGQEAIDLYERMAPDIVFLDIHMPGMAGLEVLERIMELDKDASIIMFSARSTEANIAKARELGAKGFITKPFTVEVLQTRMAHALVGNYAE